VDMSEYFGDKMFYYNWKDWNKKKIK
jgi:hypothetical protein